jgi:hypothetical protein
MKMRKTIIAAMFLALTTFAFAQTGQPSSEAIDLKDGGKVYMQKDGKMVHMDAAGNRVRMRDGVVMETKDGSKIMMKNDAIWKQITEHGTLKPGH